MRRSYPTVEGRQCSTAEVVVALTPVASVEELQATSHVANCQMDLRSHVSHCVDACHIGDPQRCTYGALPNGAYNSEVDNPLVRRNKWKFVFERSRNDEAIEWIR